MAAEGGELVTQLSLAIKHRITLAELASSFYPYLTLSEGIKLAALTFTKGVSSAAARAFIEGLRIQRMAYEMFYLHLVYYDEWNDGRLLWWYGHFYVDRHAVALYPFSIAHCLAGEADQEVRK